jgi:hypothetical protein
MEMYERWGLGGKLQSRFKSACGCGLNGNGTSLSLEQDDEKPRSAAWTRALLQLAVGIWKFTAMACVT